MNPQPVQEQPHPVTEPPSRGAASVVRRHPLLAFVVPAIGLTWLVQLAFLAQGWPLFPALVVEILVLVTAAVTVTRVTEGRAGVRRLFAGVLRWRFGIGWYAVVLTAMPVLTVAVAAAAGTLRGPENGWGAELFQYAFLTLVFGALLGNVWEEVAWTGFLQSRLTAQRGLFTGAMLTAVPFALIHLPLVFEADGLTGTSLRDVALGWTLLVVSAPFFRYLIGLVHRDTGRSLLAVALLHASFNASGALSVVSGGWEYAPAMGILTLAVAAVQSRRLRARAS